MTLRQTFTRAIFIGLLLYPFVVFAQDQDEPPPSDPPVYFSPAKQNLKSSDICETCGPSQPFNSPQLLAPTKGSLKLLEEISSKSNPPPGALSASVAPCCKVISTGKQAEDSYVYTLNGDSKWTRLKSNRAIVPFDEDEDPYVTGPSFDFVNNPSGSSLWFGYSDHKYYKFEPNKVLGSKDQIRNAISYQVPLKKNDETLEQYYMSRLKKELKMMNIGGDFNKVITEAGSGNFSKVYFIHDPIPDDAALKNLYPEVKPLRETFPFLSLNAARKRRWLLDNAKEVIKINKPCNESQTQRRAIQARRDIVFGEIFETLANSYRYIPSGNPKDKGVPIVEAVKYSSDSSQIGRGVLRQKAVHGETAYEIASRIRKAEAGDKESENYLIKVLKFKNITDAKIKINVLENFYRSVHNDVYNFGSKNNLITINGFSYTNEVVDTAFDYNHGKNVIWDPKAQIFKAIDF